MDSRPRLILPIGPEVRIGIVGRTNSGKTKLFNDLTGANATVSPRIFTTREVMIRSGNVSDDRFASLAKLFP